MNDPNTSGVNFLPTLVIDADPAAAEQLAQQLKHSGFTVDIADTGPAALTAVSAKYYRSVIFVGDLEHSGHLQYVAELRKRTPHTWIIMVGVTEDQVTRDFLLHYGVDAIIVAPFSLVDLVLRLVGFSQRSRLS